MRHRDDEFKIVADMALSQSARNRNDGIRSDAAPLLGEARQLPARANRIHIHGCRSAIAILRRKCKPRRAPAEAASGLANAYASDSSTAVPHSPLINSNSVSRPASEAIYVSILCANVRSIAKNNVELAYLIEQHSPDILALQETWLNHSTEEFAIADYIRISRRDRKEARTGGGVCIYAKRTLNCIVHVANSDEAEIVWQYLHTDRGLILLGNIYRPPGSPALILTSLRTELNRYVSNVVGVILVGDFNIHHRKWLRFSNANTADGETLHEMCQEFGLRQLVQEPTRGNY